MVAARGVVCVVLLRIASDAQYAYLIQCLFVLRGIHRRVLKKFLKTSIMYRFVSGFERSLLSLPRRGDAAFVSRFLYERTFS